MISFQSQKGSYRLVAFFAQMTELIKGKKTNADMLKCYEKSFCKLSNDDENAVQ